MRKKSGWQLSGDGPNAYEKYIVPAYTKAWAKELVTRACLREGEKILDVACGTGLVARTAAEVLGDGRQVSGIDVNEVMIEKAREIEKDINWHNGDVTDMLFSENYFNVLLCQQGFQYFSDQAFALEEMNRVLAENGPILLSVWRPIKYSPFYESLYRALEKYLNPNAASTLLAAFSLDDGKKLRILLESAGFKNINISIVVKQMSYSPFNEFLRGGLMATPFFKDIMEMQTSKREEMLLNIYNANHDYIDDNGLVAPMECYIVSANK